MRMKQHGLFLCVGIGGDHSIGLATVACGARETDVLEDRFAASGSRHDVLEFKDGDGQAFGCSAVGTTVGETVTNFTPEIGGDINAHAPVAPAC